MTNPQQAECPTCGNTDTKNGFFTCAHASSSVPTSTMVTVGDVMHTDSPKDREPGIEEKCEHCGHRYDWHRGSGWCNAQRYGAGHCPCNEFLAPTAPIEAQEAKFYNMGEVHLCRNCNGMKHLNTSGLCGRCAPHPEATQGELRQHNELDSLLTKALMKEHSDDWDMDTVREAALICSNVALAYLTTTATRMAVEARKEVHKSWSIIFGIGYDADQPKEKLAEGIVTLRNKWSRDNAELQAQLKEEGHGA
jgi:hypothetical protein